jgi:hypothetical protein
MAAEISKPDFSYQWSSGGAIVAPSNVKIQTGWTAEVPPFQWENYLQNRQDNAILHLFQKGISEWDALSNYYFTTSGVRSYVQGSDGIIYVAVSDSIGQDPTTDLTDTYWKVAFADNSTALTTTTGDARYTQRANNLSDLASAATARDNLGVANAVAAGISGTFSNLKISTTGTSALVTLTADSVCLKDSSNFQAVVNSVSLSINLAGSGANGLDAGASAINTWYSVWVIWNGTTVSGLLSLSATTPTLPGGYTHKARVGWIRSDSTANKYPLNFNQSGNRAQYKVAAGSNVTAKPTMASSGVDIIETAVSVVNFVPATASSIITVVSLGTAAAGTFTVYVGPSVSDTNTSGMATVNTLPGQYFQTDILLQASTIGWNVNASSTGNAILCCDGWVDNL